MDFKATVDLGRFQRWLYVAWFDFVVTYRKTTLGPFWLLVGPALFIAVLGALYSRVNSVSADVLIPHLTIGLILWTLIGGFVTKSTTVFQRNRAQILQGSMSLTDIVMVDVITIFLQFLHQIIIIVVVLLIFRQDIGLYALVSLLGLTVLIANGLWLSMAFGILGARYRDLYQVAAAIMRMAFLATPIIWVTRPGLGPFLLLNPFYHFLEIVRAPLLGNPVPFVSWAVVLALTAGGFIFAVFLYRRYGRLVPLWV